MEVEQFVGWTTPSLRQERGLAIQALAHQADVSAAWLDRLAKVLGIEAWRLACASRVRRSDSQLEMDRRPHLEASG